MNDLNLRIFARVEDPSQELFDYLAVKENVADPLECWVDLATPRDFEWSDEIREKTAEFGVADEDGEILAQFATLEAAENARGKAKVKLSLILEDEEEAPKAKKGAKATEAPTVSEMLSNAGSIGG